MDNFFKSLESSWLSSGSVLWFEITSFSNIIPASFMIASKVNMGALKRIAMATASEVLESNSTSLPLWSKQ